MSIMRFADTTETCVILLLTVVLLFLFIMR